MKKIENLTDMLKSIFIEHNYEVTDYSNLLSQLEINKLIRLENVFFANLNVKTKTNYFLVISLSNEKELSNVLKVQGRLANYMKYKINEKDLERNISLIICFKNEDDSKKIDMSRVLEVEEDPYYFKKYILEYSEEELKQLIKNYFTTQPNNRVEDILLNIISDNPIYENYRRNKKSGRAYSLVSKIYMKVPFLKLKINQESSLISLQKNIDEALSHKELLLVKNTLLEKKWKDNKSLYEALKLLDNNEGEVD